MKIGRIILIFFAFLLILDLTGCVERFTFSPPPEKTEETTATTPQSPQQASPAPTSLRIAVSPEDLVDYGILSDAANILRDALGVNIDFVSTQSDCDLFVGTSAEIMGMVQEGKLQPLNDIISDTSSPLTSAFSQGGSVYALPLGGKGKVLLINTSLLLEKGLPPRAPATFEEWAKMMRLLKSRGVQYPLLLPMKGDYILEDFELFSAIYGGSSYSQDKPNFTDASRRALVALSALSKDDLIDPRSYEADEEEAKEAVKGGGCVFTVVWGDDLPSGVEVALVPPSQDIYDLEKKPAVSLGKVKGVALMANSPMAKEAKAFLRLVGYLNKKNNRDLESLALSYASPCPSFRSYPQENQVVARFVYSAVQGIVSPEEALNRAKDALKAIPQPQVPQQQVPQQQLPQQQIPQPSTNLPAQPSTPSAQPQVPTNQPPGYQLNIPSG
ncbi:extracellular solute-binding protein [bacterium]|nr:extracellular solute-binding protein [bacterium]